MTDALRHPGFTDDESVVAVSAGVNSAPVPYRPEQIFSDWGA